MKITRKILENLIKEQLDNILQEKEMTSQEASRIIQKLTARVRTLEKELETLKPGELRVGPGLPDTIEPDLVINKQGLGEQRIKISANPTRRILARDLNVALQQLDQKLDQILARLEQEQK